MRERNTDNEALIVGDKVSALISFVPAFVRNHATRIPLLRRLTSRIRGRLLNIHTGPKASDFPLSTGSNSLARTQHSDSDSCQLCDEDFFSRPVSSSSTLPVFPTSDIDTGISWKYAYQASNLLTQAISESSSFELDPARDHPTSLCRDLYISSVNYLLRGLPPDLTAPEALTLQASLPEYLTDTITAQQGGDADSKVADTHRPESEVEEPSIIHRAFAYLVLQAFILCHFCLPYVRVLLREAYAYERRHRISERVFATSLDTIDEVGKRGVGLVESVYAIDEGRFGHGVNETVVRWVREVCGGLREGLREGVGVLKDGRVQAGKR